jgi:hypothetical protein
VVLFFNFDGMKTRIGILGMGGVGGYFEVYVKRMKALKS